MRRHPFTPLPRQTESKSKAPLPTPPRFSRKCAAHLIAAAANLSIEEICARAADRPMNRDYFLQLCRQGGAPYPTARRLADITGLSPLVFRWGLNEYLKFHRHLGVLDMKLS